MARPVVVMAGTVATVWLVSFVVRAAEAIRLLGTTGALPKKRRGARAS
jgi:hypothetical protein